MFKYKNILEKRKEYLIGGKNNDKSIIEYFEDESSQIIKKLNEIVHNDGYLEYLDNIVKIKEQYGDLLILAKTYKMYGTKYFENDQILKIIVDSLDLFNKHYYNKSLKEHTNWWQWEIGIPLILNNIFSLLYEDIDYEIIKKNLDTTFYFQPDPRYSGNNPVAIHPSGNPLRLSSGGNRADTAKISFFRGIILSDEQEVIKALDSLEDIWTYIDGTSQTDGFYKDGSFIQHGSIAYAGGYGEVLLMGIAEIFYVLKDTNFTQYIKGQSRLYDIIFDSFAPFFFNGRFSDMLSGRGITRLNNDTGVIGHRILDDILLISTVFPESERNITKNFVRNEILKYGKEKYLEEEKSPFIYDILKKLLQEETTTKEYLPEINVCNRMGRMVKRTQNYAIGIAMHSHNIGNYESMNGENTKGWYTGDGAYYLYDFDRQADNNYWQNVDMYYIPGTTEVKMNMEGVDAQRNIETTFVENKQVGGISIGEYGIGVMKFTNWNETLNSRKSWCFLKGKLIFIEDKIESNMEIYTTIFNRKYQIFPKIVVDGEEIFNKNMTKKIKSIVINNWEIRFTKYENINIKVEEIKKCYYVKIWKEKFEEKHDKKFIWELISLEEKIQDEYKLLLKDKGYILETDNMILTVDWADNTICKIYDKNRNIDRKLRIE